MSVLFSWCSHMHRVLASCLRDQPPVCDLRRGSVHSRELDKYQNQSHGISCRIQ